MDDERGSRVDFSDVLINDNNIVRTKLIYNGAVINMCIILSLLFSTVKTVYVFT